MRILAAVIIFNSDYDLLRENISKYIYDVEQTVVWDNSIGQRATLNRRWLNSNFPKAVYMTDGENVGIAKALNKVSCYADKNNFDVLLTMDDDSVFDDFKSYHQRAVKEWETNGLSIISPTVNVSRRENLQNYVLIDDAITSGMLVPLTILKAVGGYEEKFFLEAIDVDLCYNARRHGYKVLADSSALLLQRYGKPVHVKLRGHDMPYNDYAPSRLYAVFRNHIYLCKRYHWPKSLLWKIFRQYFIGLVLRSALLGGNNSMDKFKAAFRGTADGIKMK